MSNTSIRNYGIDLMRIVSMFMVALIHVLGLGGVLEATSLPSSHYVSASLLLDLVICAVDCFALVSGYVGYGSSHKCKGIVGLYLQAAFYTVGLTGIFLLADPASVGFKDVLKSLVPVRQMYWYLEAYFSLFFFFMPFLDALVDYLDEANCRRLMFTIFMILAVVPTLLMCDFAGAKGGYTLQWLAALYIVGAVVRKLNISGFGNNAHNLCAYLVLSIAAWALKFAIEIVAMNRVQTSVGDYFINYTSPLILGAAFFLLLFFSRLKLRRLVPFVRFFAPLSFGVYLLHMGPFVMSHVLGGAFAKYAQLNPALMCVAAIATALGIWLVGSLVDYVRLMLFKWLHVDQLCDWIGGRLDGLLGTALSEMRMQ